MFFQQHTFSLRPASPADREAVAALTRRAHRVHAHLDWQPAEDWLGTQPFLLLEDGHLPVAALACPPDPPDTAWIRLLALGSHSAAADWWNRLWPAARESLEVLDVKGAAVLSLAGWIDAYCRPAGFAQTHEVVVLSRESRSLPGFASSPAELRPAGPADGTAVIAADTRAFAPPWQHSAALLGRAIERAEYLTVAEVAGRVVGYQLTTPGAHGAHLARLAVLPEWQGRGIGAALVADMLTHYAQQGAPEITVNTQSSNTASLRLYQRLGFAATGARFPVYQLALA